VKPSRAGATALLAGLAVGAAGCLSLKRTPEARFFVLRAVAEPVPASAEGALAGIVTVLPVRLPDHLDRPQVVTWTAPGELGINEFVRWGEPLDAGITRALAEDLAVLLPEHRVLRYPWAAAVKPRCRVAADVQVFGLQPSAEVRLEGRWALLPGDGERPLFRAPVSLGRGPLAHASGRVEPGAAVEALSALLADLSRAIADRVRALPAEAGDPAPARTPSAAP
jgi:uncharacterized lipoprotein YmbA